MATPIRFTANDVIAAAFADLGVYTPGESIPAAEAWNALLRLNALISGLSLSPSTFPFINREVFPVVAGQSTYTMGPGGDFSTIRPMEITAAGLLMPATAVTTGTVEIPRSLLTDDAYQAIQVKDMQSPMWTAVFYDPTYADGFGSVYLWPTPSVTTYQLVLYRGQAIQGFTNLTTSGDYPPGALEMLQYELGRRLAPGYGGSGWTAMLEELRKDATFAFKRNNYRPVDLALDPALTWQRGHGYNIETNQ